MEIRFAQHRDRRLTPETFLDKIDRRTRVVACAYVTYGNRYRVDLPGLGKICRERDIRLVVDGVQAAGILAALLSELGADMVAICGHKGLLGLTGTGLLYCCDCWGFANPSDRHFSPLRTRTRTSPCRPTSH